MRWSRSLIWLPALALLALGPAGAGAEGSGTVLVRQGSFPPKQVFDFRIAPAFAEVRGVANLMSATDFVGVDGVFIDLAFQEDVLAAAELTNLASYLAGGGRVVAMGENTAWEDWNDSILGVVGATSSGTTGGYAFPIFTHEPTDSIEKVYDYTGSSVVTTIGQQLFDIPFATLWGGNYLTILDSNAFEAFTFVGTDHDNIQFRNNVVGWLGGDVTIIPEPGTGLLLASGLIGLCEMRRRRGANGRGANG